LRDYGAGRTSSLQPRSRHIFVASMKLPAGYSLDSFEMGPMTLDRCVREAKRQVESDSVAIHQSALGALHRCRPALTRSRCYLGSASKPPTRCWVWIWSAPRCPSSLLLFVSLRQLAPDLSVTKAEFPPQEVLKILAAVALGLGTGQRAGTMGCLCKKGSRQAELALSTRRRAGKGASAGRERLFLPCCAEAHLLQRLRPQALSHAGQ
jgi:hypothetical protein